ncbi:unnamed protein product [Ceratitis capitata]|uniref:(Mediterranean fruit fly) hypothetical protein n=1 Tax=Ceratitis capitata TaxID=7213 RepID=A0A811V734_CERCA|nr:unnamed protein product [Ceratitis capitata]
MNVDRAHRYRTVYCVQVWHEAACRCETRAGSNQIYLLLHSPIFRLLLALFLSLQQPQRGQQWAVRPPANQPGSTNKLFVESVIKLYFNYHLKAGNQKLFCLKSIVGVR